MAAFFGGAVGKDPVSWFWSKTKGDCDVRNALVLKGEPIVRLTFADTAARVRLDKNATFVSLLAA